MPPVPKTLLCTFDYWHHTAPPPEARIAGTILLTNTPPAIVYTGAWNHGLDALMIDANYDPATSILDALVMFFAGPYFEMATYPPKLIARPPNLLFEARNAETVFERWTSILIITC